MTLQIIIGFFIALSIALAAWRLKTLTTSGALAALIMGTVIFGFGGLAWATLLVIFFLTSSLLSKVKRQNKQAVNQNFAKDSRRDWAQVLANGGVAMFLVILHILFPQFEWVWPAFAASLAAANADTWSTELGVLSPHAPRLIIGFRKTEKGTSGAVSLYGTLAGLSGSLLIAIFAVILWQGSIPVSPWLQLILISVSGLGGSLVDSLAGATTQAIYYCPTCQKETEQHPQHHCGTTTNLVKGQSWINNEIVNLLCTLSAAVAIFIFNLL